jgi:hypothetical protein
LESYESENCEGDYERYRSHKCILRYFTRTDEPGKYASKHRCADGGRPPTECWTIGVNKICHRSGCGGRSGGRQQKSPKGQARREASRQEPAHRDDESERECRNQPCHRISILRGDHSIRQITLMLPIRDVSGGLRSLGIVRVSYASFRSAARLT